MQIDVDVGSYSKKHGLQLTWMAGYSLTVVLASGEVVIRGNEAGLRSLASHCLTLADAAVPAGVHAHLEPHHELDDDSAPLVLDKR